MSGLKIDYRSAQAVPPPNRVRRVAVRIVILVAAVAAILFIAAVATFAYHAKNINANRAKAKAHIPVVQAKIANDARFAKVELCAGSRAGGSLAVCGIVASAADLAVLQRTVQSTSPPVPVEWVVSVPVQGPNATRPTSD